MFVRRIFLLLIVTSLEIAPAFSLNGRGRKQANRTFASGAFKQRHSDTVLTEKSSVIDENRSPDNDYVTLANTSERFRSSDEDSDADIDLDGKLCNVQRRNCMCVPWYQCKNDDIIKDGEGLIDERKKMSESFCREQQVCCNLNVNKEAEMDELRERATEYENKEAKCGERNSCGIDRRLLKPKLAGEADFGEWPWQAIVLTSLEEDEEKYLYTCGAALISQKWVLTVAHCLNKLTKEQLSNLVVRLGEWDVETDDDNKKEFLKHVNIKVKDIHMHPKFNRRNLHNDIALLKLEDEIEYKPHISPVCVPSENLLIDSKLWTANCVVTGWGKSPDKLSTYSRILKELSLPLMERNKCQKLLRKTRLGDHFVLNPGFICAGGEQDVDACTGDGGGPLVCRHSNRWLLLGLVSWGVGCGERNVPGVYVNVAHYNTWIKSVIDNDD